MLGWSFSSWSGSKLSFSSWSGSKLSFSSWQAVPVFVAMFPLGIWRIDENERYRTFALFENGADDLNKISLNKSGFFLSDLSLRLQTENTCGWKWGKYCWQKLDVICLDALSELVLYEFCFTGFLPITETTYLVRFCFERNCTWVNSFFGGEFSSFLTSI